MKKVILKTVFLSCPMIIFGAAEADYVFPFAENENLPSYQQTINPLARSLSEQKMIGQLSPSQADQASKVFSALTTLKNFVSYQWQQPHAPKSLDEISLGAKLQIALATKNAEWLENLMRLPEASNFLFSSDTNGLSLFSVACLQEEETCIRTVAKSQGHIIDHPLLGGYTTTLGLIIQIGTPKIAKLLLELGADPDKARATDIVGERLAAERSHHKNETDESTEARSTAQELMEILATHRGEQQKKAIERVASEKLLPPRSSAPRSTQS